MKTKLLTTGQAARVCSVTADTVLKWIHSGALPARRTAGGHHRIEERDLARFRAPARRQDELPGAGLPAEPRDGLTRYCWEYNTAGELPLGCRECAVYKLRAQRCYEVARLEPQLGHTKLFCKEDCLDCEYYRRVHLQDTNVIVVTDDKGLTEALRREQTEAPYNLELSHCEYTCSALVDSFRPDYVVVDCSFGSDRSTDICNHLLEDPRIPFVRVVIAVDEATFPSACDKKVFARIQRPFGVSDITECIERAQDGRAARPA